MGVSALRFGKSSPGSPTGRFTPAVRRVIGARVARPGSRKFRLLGTVIASRQFKLE